MWSATTSTSTLRSHDMERLWRVERCCGLLLLLPLLLLLKWRLLWGDALLWDESLSMLSLRFRFSCLKYSERRQTDFFVRSGYKMREEARAEAFLSWDDTWSALLHPDSLANGWNWVRKNTEMFNSRVNELWDEECNHCQVRNMMILQAIWKSV